MTHVHPFLGISFSCGPIDDIVQQIVGAARGDRTKMLVTPNVHHVVALDRQLPPETVARQDAPVMSSSIPLEEFVPVTERR